MEIEIDFQPSPSRSFFISVSLNEKEAISFDYTVKGHRIIKQILVEKKEFPEGGVDGEWDAIVLKDGKLMQKYHVKWIDLDKRDWVNNEIWETVWEKQMTEKLGDRLLEYSRFISDNYKNPDKLKGKMKEFEGFLKREVSKHLRERKI